MVKKLHFTKSGEKKPAKTTSTFNDVMSIVHWRTIEIKNGNPSELVMVIEKRNGLSGSRIEEIPLVDFRTYFQYQNGIYILDVRHFDRFFDSEGYTVVTVSFESIPSDIDVEVFYFLEDPRSFTHHQNTLISESEIPIKTIV